MEAYALLGAAVFLVCLAGYAAYRFGAAKPASRDPIEYTVRVWGEWPPAPDGEAPRPCRVEMEYRVVLGRDSPAALRQARGRCAAQAMDGLRRLCGPLGEAARVGAVRFAPVDDDAAQRDTL